MQGFLYQLRLYNSLLRVIDHFTLVMHSTGQWWWRQWGGLIRQKKTLRTYFMQRKCTFLSNQLIGNIYSMSLSSLHIFLQWEDCFTNVWWDFWSMCDLSDRVEALAFKVWRDCTIDMIQTTNFPYNHLISWTNRLFCVELSKSCPFWRQILPSVTTILELACGRWKWMRIFPQMN